MTNEITRVRRFIVEQYSLEELRTLSFDLGFDYDELGGEGKSVLVRELLELLGRQRRFAELLAVLQRERPQLFPAAGLRSEPAFVEQLYRQLPALGGGDGGSVQPEPAPVRQPDGAAAPRNLPRMPGLVFGAIAVVVLLAIALLIQRNAGENSASPTAPASAGDAEPAATAALPGSVSQASEATGAPPAAFPTAGPTDTPQPAELPGGVAQASEATGAPPAIFPTFGPTATPQPVELPGGAPLTLSWSGGAFRVSLLSAEVERTSPGKRLLTLHASASTSAGGGMRFCSHCDYRLRAGDRSFEPVTLFWVTVPQDEPDEREIQFEIDDWTQDAVLVVRFSSEQQEIPLVLPSPAPMPAPTSPPPSSVPVGLPDGPSLTLFFPGYQLQYTILSAYVRPLSAGVRVLDLRIRSWTDGGAGALLRNDSFRLRAGDATQTPINALYKGIPRDVTVDGDVQFEIDDTLRDAVLVITYGGETRELRLAIP